MWISQHDVAQVDDNTLKLLVLAADEAERTDPQLAPIWRPFKHALVRVIKERRRLWLLAAMELTDDDEEGAIVPDPEETP